MTIGPGLVRRALAGHASIGLLAAALIYVVSLTGTLLVIHDRWQRWEQPHATEAKAITPAAMQAAFVAAVAPEGRTRPTQFTLRLPTDDFPRAIVTTERSSRLVDAEGRLAEVPRSDWTDFVTDLHETLTLPSGWGLLLVGAIGVVLAAAVLTGVISHPRIFRDAFRLRARHLPQLARADLHNRLGVWTLPFALAIALTGALLGLGSLGFGALARAYHGGSVEAAYAPVFGFEPRPDRALAPLPDIGRDVAALRLRVPDASPTYVIVHAPSTRGQFVQIVARLPRRLVYGEGYGFDGDGRWLGAAGLSDGRVGQQIAASTYGLHFGNFGGLAVEIAYLAFGLSICVVTATGVTLWLIKRRRRGMPGDRLAACWTVVVWGTPLLLIFATWSSAAGISVAHLDAVFWMAFASLGSGALFLPKLIARVAPGVVAVTMIVTGAGHVMRWPGEAAPLLVIDALLIVLPLVLLAAGGGGKVHLDAASRANGIAQS